MKTAVLTGFENFGPYNGNATERLVRTLNRKTIVDHKIHSLVFPVAIFPPAPENYGKKIVIQAMEIGANAIISLGMASDVKGIRFESTTANWVENQIYCHPSENKRRVDDELSEETTYTINMDRWNLETVHAQLAEKNIPFEQRVSLDAGRYCCNALMFRTLQAMDELQCTIPYIFAHVACTARAIWMMKNFDPRKTLLTELQLKDTIGVMLASYR